MADEWSERSASRGSTTREGFAVLGVAIRREPLIFTLSTVGSLLFGVMTVADAWVLGWATDHVVIPAFRDGDIATGLLWAVLGLFMAVAVLRAVGIVARRLGAGVMQYRMQAHTRRAVTRQYLTLPMEWHQRHPTGQLLSNAYSDVEAAWGPIAPLPMAVGTVVMMVVAVVQMFVADLVLAMVGLFVFPAVIVTNVVYQRFASGWATRAQQLRAEVSEIAHESFDGAMVVKTLGRETEETDRFTAKAHELRDANIRVGLFRAAFDPTLAALPNLGVMVVLAVGVERVLSGRHRRRRRGDGRLPADDRLVPDPLARLAARRVPAQRGGLPPHPAGDRGDRCDALRPRRAARLRPRRPARGRRAGLRLRRRRAAPRRASPSTSSPAARSPWSARPPPARAPSPA